MSSKKGPPDDVTSILKQLDKAFRQLDATGRAIGDARFGVYAFYDYDGEPIYVGQTVEGIRTRIRRHLTNQRTDAVAMSVLDPFEVLEIEMWPFWSFHDRWHSANGRQAREAISKEAKRPLASAEFTAYSQLLEDSEFQAVLNEKVPTETPLVELPRSLRVRIVPDEVYRRRIHPDVRVAQRAATIARLADIISRRRVQVGLRTTLLTQAERLRHLAKRRLDDLE